jgi:uncharacterized small protein (DUF1192 family)
MIDEDASSPRMQIQLKNLEPMSIDELEHYIIGLEDEIDRAEAEIKSKKSHMERAGTFFKA